MDTTGKTYCNTHYRHLRLLFFVHAGVEPNFLIDLFTDNYQLWGGRYNPVIPVYNDTISPLFRQDLDAFDPDIVFYTVAVGVERAKRFCRNIHPREFIQLPYDGHYNLPGVYAHHLLPEGQRQYLRLLKPFSLVYFNNHENGPVNSFYNLSFGIGNRYVEDIALAQGYRAHELDVNDLAGTNQYLARERPFYNVLLSELQVEIKLLSPTNPFEMHRSELVIYDEQNAFEDLVYFWNRQLYQRPETRIRQIIASSAQIALLLAADGFGPLLQSIASDGPVFLTSLSLSTEQLEEQMASLRATCPGVGFRIIDDTTFPRTQQAESYPYQRAIAREKQVLLGKKDYLRLPAPVWKPEAPPVRGTYVYDLEFYKEGEHTVNWLKLPYGTITNFLLANHSSRVNKDHHVSYYLNTETPGLDINVPTAAEIFQTRLRTRMVDGEIVHTSVEYLQPSDAGLKLSAFVNLFDQRLSAASEFINEKFWIDLVLGESTGNIKKSFEFHRTMETPDGPVDERFHEKVPKSNIFNFDGIFSYEDLRAERKLIYLENREGIRAWLQEHGQQTDDDELLRFINQSQTEDFSMHIDPDLQYLVDRDALFIGMKVKCRNCGTNAWYPLAELKNKFPCKGCLQTVIPVIQSHLYYRFNDAVYNNISSDPVKRAKSYHGNYIVLRTLSALSRGGAGFQSFHWSTSMDVGIRSGQSVTPTDIDLLMLQNGLLILGEAKANATLFTRDQLTKLKLMAETFRPDKVILAYMEGNLPAERITALTAELKEMKCELIIHQVSPPQYFFGRIR
ncbi:MAG: hypothetical protein V4592_05495 [Bacteroidota bacterium]